MITMSTKDSWTCNLLNLLTGGVPILVVIYHVGVWQMKVFHSNNQSGIILACTQKKRWNKLRCWKNLAFKPWLPSPAWWLSQRWRWWSFLILMTCGPSRRVGQPWFNGGHIWISFVSPSYHWEPSQISSLEVVCLANQGSVEMYLAEGNVASICEICFNDLQVLWGILGSRCASQAQHSSRLEGFLIPWSSLLSPTSAPPEALSVLRCHRRTQGPCSRGDWGLNRAFGGSPSFLGLDISWNMFHNVLLSRMLLEQTRNINIIKHP